MHPMRAYHATINIATTTTGDITNRLFSHTYICVSLVSRQLMRARGGGIQRSLCSDVIQSVLLHL